MGNLVSGTNHDAVFYVQIQPSWANYTVGGEYPVRDIHAIRITQTKPNKPIPGTVIVKLTLRLPDAVFKPLQPEAVVIIPTDMSLISAIEVTALDPNDPVPEEETDG